jgi:hypothetical protein
VGVDPIGYPLVALTLVFELLEDLLGVSCMHLIILMMKFDSHCHDVLD